MLETRRFKAESYLPTRQAMQNTCLALKSNLQEMKKLAAAAAALKNSEGGDEQKRLLFLASCFFDFYLLAEDCFLQIARSLDRWIPGSLDWRRRLVSLMLLPNPEKRPSLISPRTADLLNDFLVLAVNYHQHCSKLSAEKADRMAVSLDELYDLLEEELTQFIKLFGF